MRRGLSSIVFCCGHARGVLFLLRVRGAFYFLLRVRGALFSVLSARGALFFCCGYAASFFSSVRNAFFFVLQVRGVFFFSAGVWRGLFSTAGAGGGPCMAVGCGSRGVRFFIWARGGMICLRRRVHVFAAGARRVCLFFAAAAGGVSCAEQRRRTFIHMVALKKMVWYGLGMAGLGSKTVKNSGLARLGSDRVGLAKERVGNSGDSAGGLGR